MAAMLTLQATMFLLMLTGYVIRRLGIVTREGQKCITDLVLDVVMPANIIMSFTVSLDGGALGQFGLIFVISVLVQVFSVALGKVTYRRHSTDDRKCLQYAIICSNAGFLGNPMAEGVFGSMGLALASIYLVPQRVMMWSSGLSLFNGQSNWKATMKKAITHPCIIACFVGLLLMVTGMTLPDFIAKPMRYLGSCNTALSMMMIGMILCDVDLRRMFDRVVLSYSFIRMIFIPVVVLIACKLCGVNDLVTGVSVLLSAMPAGSTTAIFAAKYLDDPGFGTRLVVGSTILSILTTALWQLILT